LVCGVTFYREEYPCCLVTAGVFSYPPKQSALIHSKMAILFIIYTLRFAPKSAKHRYGIYADIKSESVVLRILKSRIPEFMQA
jgi:hypothetical protein